MIGRLRQLSQPRLRQQARIEKSQTPVERDILVQWVRKLLIEYGEPFVGRTFCSGKQTGSQESVPLCKKKLLKRQKNSEVYPFTLTLVNHNI